MIFSEEGLCGLPPVVTFRMCLSNSRLPYSVLRRTRCIPQLRGEYLKVFCVETVAFCWRVGVRCSLRLVCNSLWEKLTYFQALLSPLTAFFLLSFEKGSAIEVCIPRNFILGCRRTVGRQGVQEIILLALPVPTVISI